jgi:hypothetical protein
MREIRYPDGTVRHIYIDLTAQQPKPQRQPWVWHYIRSTILVFTWLVGLITAGLLGLEWPQLNPAARLVCAAYTALATAGYVVHAVRVHRARREA